jgi:hypothetical protein
MEDVNWLSEVGVPYHVYDKGGKPSEWVRLPNVGREAQTYLHHCMTNYASLSDLVVFCQGDPLRHSQDFFKSVSSLARLDWEGNLSKIPTYLDLCSKFAGHYLKPLDWVEPLFSQFAPRHLDLPMPPGHYYHGSGATFAVKKEAIQARPVSDYVDLEAWVLGNHRGPWLMELIWAYFWAGKSQLVSEAKTMLDMTNQVGGMTVLHPDVQQILKGLSR